MSGNGKAITGLMSKVETLQFERALAARDAKVTAAERARTREMASLVVRLVERVKVFHGAVEHDPLFAWVLDAEARANALLGKAPARGRKPA